jgi:hypothetical protein
MRALAAVGIACGLLACSGRAPIGDAGWLDQGPVAEGPPRDGPAADLPPGSCVAGADQDHDTIPDLVEGCAGRRDSDADGTPDFQDADSDGDGIPDAAEAGDAEPATPPVDSDHDGAPDVLDLDSDGDTLPDGIEDWNHDGRLGCCRTVCGEAVPGCPAVPAGGCAPGQGCTAAGLCSPAAHLACARGETSPRLKDTFGLGGDPALGNTICSPTSAANPNGRKALKLQSSSAGAFQLALEPTTRLSELAIPGAQPVEAAAALDEDAPAAEVAGFVLSRPPDAPGTTVQEELALQLQAIANAPPFPGVLAVVGSGVEQTSHDGFPAVVSTTLAFTPSLPANVASVRNELVARWLKRPALLLGNLPAPFGVSQGALAIRFTTVRRPDRVLVIGAVAGLANSKDPGRPTGVRLDDLAGGSALAQPGATLAGGCDSHAIQALPVADLIWVVDESGSMDDNRKDIVANASELFARALASGLDFRMGVTGMNDPQGAYPAILGKLCSKATTQSSDDGGQDRFLLPSEQSLFAACVSNPPGYEGGKEYGLTNAREAVKRHLPRAPSSPDRIRSDAKLVLIVVSDEAPQELSDAGVLGAADLLACTLPAAKQTAVEAAIAPALDLFQGTSDPEGAAILHVVGGVCGNACSAQIAHGYKELAYHLGGHLVDVCQKDLGASLQLIIDSVVGASSPIVLTHRPIAASLSVRLDGKPLARSRAGGFDYAPHANAIPLINVTYHKGSAVVVSYSHWE